MRRAYILLLSTALTALAAGTALGDDAAVDGPLDVIRVEGRYLSIDKLDAVKTPTPIIDVPQSLSIVTADQIALQGFESIGDILRYTPGLSISQGEGHRDAINIRGNQTTADFFLNGIRDDVQYYRPLYNLQQIEILRGANALLFGRGGGGGVINRVTKSPLIDERFAVLSAAADTFGGYEAAADVNLDAGPRVAARLNAYVEELRNHRDAYEGERYAVNPTLRADLSDQTTAELFYERVDDDRVVDRGVPSVSVADGPDTPLRGARDVFFGDPEANNTTLEADLLRARVDHVFSDALRGNATLQYAQYDKAYQNIYPAGFDASAAPSLVTLDGYRDVTDRENLILQANLIGEFRTGRLGHTLLFGVEYGDQETANAREDTVFAATNDDQVTVAFDNGIEVPDFAFSNTVRDRTSEVSFTSLYLQDQIDLTDAFKLVLGARFDEFDVSVFDAQAVSPGDDGRRSRVDDEISPRLGFIYKPAENVSIYASYSETFLPSAGDQFLTLTPTSEDIQPQVFENQEIGAKWDIRPGLSFTASVFRLERGLFTTVDPDDAATTITVPGSTTDGLELQLVGDLTERWYVSAGYSYLDGEVEGGAQDGNVTRQTPEHMASLWTRYAATDRLGLALGVTYQDAFFVLEDNAVEVPNYTRVDAAAFYDLTDATRIQLNIENLFDTDYFPDAHNNDNISTGAPLNARVRISHRF
jgi:catecholate siderophore receptor